MEEGSFSESPARTGGGGSLEIKPLLGAGEHGERRAATTERCEGGSLRSNPAVSASAPGSQPGGEAGLPVSADLRAAGGGDGPGGLGPERGSAVAEAPELPGSYRRPGSGRFARSLCASPAPRCGGAALCALLRGAAAGIPGSGREKGVFCARLYCVFLTSEDFFGSFFGRWGLMHNETVRCFWVYTSILEKSVPKNLDALERC